MVCAETDGWLKKYFETKFDALEKYFETKFTALEKATTLAANTMDKRLDTMNELRSQLKDERLDYTQKTEIEPVISRMGKDIHELQLSRAELAGKASQKSVNVIQLIAVLGLVLALINILMTLMSK